MMSTQANVGASISRRALLQSGAVVATTALVGAVIKPEPANAILGFKSQEQEYIEEIARDLILVEDLVADLKKGKLKGGKNTEDSGVIFRYQATYFEPMQKKMAAMVNKPLGLSAEDKKSFELQPLLLKGHLLELSQAVQSGVAKEQLEELEEVQETTVEFIKLALSGSKLTPPPARRGSATPGEYFGPFGCDFYGLKRMPNSNVCYQPDKVGM
eukprot:CAMPEP_0113933624 /NCGR_PEP_ID=MMETSP1339-20121228/804_1 /TAXON_ID=94617 /ORGANISM="Fibrocapsa japonica" /LENGTH=213 /DNA_ID=CAMNT_0000934981 /DNA_START=183 /DNA_END=824 /DNA_ORIENTATION=+ /assembly_acc=CAM_ASM_000762